MGTTGCGRSLLHDDDVNGGKPYNNLREVKRFRIDGLYVLLRLLWSGGLLPGVP